MIYDLAVIGAGPAGYVAAIRAGQVGLKTVVIDKKYVGGMCLNWGCIPTKALLESAKLMVKIQDAEQFGIKGIDKSQLSFDWVKAKKRAGVVVSKLTKGVEYLWKKNGVEFIQGEAKILSGTSIEVDNRVIETQHILIATGSKPKHITGIDPALVIEMETLLALDSLPEEPLIWGQGPVALEMAQFFHMIGKKVTMVIPEEPLLPGTDEYVSDFLKKKLSKDKIPMIFGVPSISNTGKFNHEGTEYHFDKIVNCNWREGILPPSEVKYDLENGFIKVNDLLQTSVATIYAAGDVNGRSALAHAASAQGLGVINHIKEIPIENDFKLYPLNIYSEPEIAQVGRTEKELQLAGIEYKVSEFPLSANGKAMTQAQTEGVLRMLYEPHYGEVLGVLIIGPDATDMIAEASLLMRMEGTVYDVAQTIHAHPTISEVFLEAGFVATGHPIHK